MKGLLGALFAIALLAVSEAALTEEAIIDLVKKSLPLGEGEGVNIRFECSPARLDQRWKSLSVGCAEFLTTNAFNPTNFPSSLRGLCQSCGEPLYQLVLDCVGDSGRFLQVLDALCATNERGVACHDVIAADARQEMFSDCEQSPCSDNCRRELIDSNQRHGCCLFSTVAALSDNERAERLWSRCGVETPRLCSGAFTSTAPPPPRSGSPSAGNSTDSRSAASKNEFSVLCLVFIMSFLIYW